MPAQATIQRTQNSSTQYGLIAVTERSFTVYNIRIRYGNAPVAGGGIVIYPGASAYIFDSKLNNNVANSSTGQGGGVYNRGKLIITNGQFNGNTAKVGGAVASYLATTRVRQGDYGTWCALFKSNSVSVNAGGVYSQDSTTKVQRSMFSANSAPSSAYRDIENSPASLPGNIVVADQSWWNGSISVSPSVSTNGSMLGSTIPGLNCAVANPPAPTLADYGIETNATSPQDLQAILAGVHKTGVALWRSFGQDGTPLDSSIDAFKRVMYGPGRSKLQINIGGSGSVCVTNNNNVPLPYQAIITCPPTPSVILSEWTVAHELGHVLVARTGGYNANDPNGKTSFFRHMLVTKIVDPANQNLVIFGDVNGTDWGRGNRGWGSSSINQSSGAPCNFQQNPLSIPNTRTPQEVDEGAADMFLNWVYRKNKSDEGFKNVDWSSFTSCQITGAIELLPSASGDLRFSRMEQVIQMMGTDRGW